jgi:hypothetical protein
MQTWEYLMSRIHMARGHEELTQWETFMNDRGNEGWDLVSVTSDKPEPELAAKSAMVEYTLFFKRCKQ